MYRLLFDLVFRRMDPERAHEVAFAADPRRRAGPAAARRSSPGSFAAPAPARSRVFGRRFPSRFGLAAGFDKNAVGVAGLTMLGFGFVEVGTVTAHAQPGNEPPRLWRVLDQRALRNRMGFNNEGSAAVAARLRRLRATPAGRRLVVGVNIGKTKVTPAEHAPADYATSAGRLAPVRRLPRGQRLLAQHPGPARPAVGRGAAPDPRGHARGGRRGDGRRPASPPSRCS